MGNPKALEEKEKGNQFFKKGNYHDAVTCYTKAIEFDPVNHLLYGNRSQAYLNLKRPQEAAQDCDLALKLDSNYVKGYLRRGTAMKMLGDNERASADFKEVLKLEPNNKQATVELKSIELSIGNKSGLIEPISSSDNVDDQPSSTTKSDLKVRSIPKKIPISTRMINRIPVNSFEFYCDWRELSEDSNKLAYIMNIGSVKLGKVFKITMEPLVFCDILRILPSCLDIPFRSRLLFELSKMEKIKTLILFLEDHEEKLLQTLIGDMKLYLEPSEIAYFMERVGPKFN